MLAREALLRRRSSTWDRNTRKISYGQGRSRTCRKKYYQTKQRTANAQGILHAQNEKLVNALARANRE